MISGALVTRTVEDIIGTADFDALPRVTDCVARLRIGRDEPHCSRDEGGLADRHQASYRVLRMLHPFLRPPVRALSLGRARL
jgi:hypothetical protein